MKTTATLILPFLFLQWGFAQNEGRDTMPEWLGSVNPRIISGIPMGEFSGAMDDEAFGLGGSFLFDIPGIPVSVGAQADYLSFSHKKLRVRNAIGNTGYERDYDWVTRSQALLIGAVFRIQPAHHFWLKPYAEGTAGWRRLFTNTTLTDRNTGDNPNVGTDIDKSDWSLYYGGALGINIPMAEDVMLDLACFFSFSPFADFYTKKNDAAPVEDPLDAFELKHSSSTNMVIPKLGVSILID